MTLVGTSPPPREPDDGPHEADSPNGGDNAAASPGPPRDDANWVPPGDDAPEDGPATTPTWAPLDPGAEPPGRREASPWSDGSGATEPWGSPGGARTWPDEQWSRGEGVGAGSPGHTADPPTQGWDPPAGGQTPPGGAPEAVWGPPGAGAPGAGAPPAPPPGPPPRGAPGWGPPQQGGWGGGGGEWGSASYQAPVALPKAGSARTGPLPLHPMSFSDVLDGAFRLLRANLATIVLVTAVFFVPLELLSAFLTRDLFGGQGILEVLRDPSLTEQQFSGGLSGVQLGGTVATSLLGLLITPFVGAAITQVVAASYLGRQLSAGDAIRTTGRRLWALLGAAILVHVVEGVALILCILPALVAMTFYICTTPVVVLEELGPVRSMRRSWRLVRPRFWPVLGIAVVSGLLASFLTSVLGTPFTLAAELVGLRWGFILLAIGSIVPALVASPFVSIVATLVYFDARIRHEGFDLQMIARGFADDSPPAS
jgi:hypothetical protein